MAMLMTRLKHISEVALSTKVVDCVVSVSVLYTLDSVLGVSLQEFRVKLYQVTEKLQIAYCKFAFNCLKLI